MINKINCLLFTSLFFLSACSTTKLAEQRFPDRIKYTFASSTTGTKNTYLCKEIDGKEKTNIRAKTAHSYLSKKISDISEESVSKLLESKGSTLVAAVKSQVSLQNGAKVAAKEIEDKFQCTLISAE